MFRVKTTRRNVKRAISPLKVATDISGAFIQQPVVKEQLQEQSQLERRVDNFFEAESAAVSLSKPWLRLERGLRLQKYRAFAEAYPGLTPIEKESLYKVLMKANDAKLLNTKTTIQYEGGAIQSIKGLKMIRTGDPTIPAVFKIDVSRPTKKHTDDV
jgi:hypothetical protein